MEPNKLTEAIRAKIVDYEKLLKHHQDFAGKGVGNGRYLEQAECLGRIMAYKEILRMLQEP